MRLVFSMLLCATSLAHASTMVPPVRPLSFDERVEFAVAESWTIALGDLVGARGPVWKFRVVEWLKGAPASRPDTILVGSNRFTTDVSKVGRRYVVFMGEHIRGETRGARARSYPTTDVDYMLETGAWELESGPIRGTIDEIRWRWRIGRMVRDHEPRRLQRRADLVVLGRPDFDHRVLCEPFGRPASCIPFAVEETLRGEAPSRTILVYFLRGSGYERGERFVALLRRDSTGSFEILSGNAGLHPVEAGESGRRALEEWRRIVAVRSPSWWPW